MSVVLCDTNLTKTFLKVDEEEFEKDIVCCIKFSLSND